MTWWIRGPKAARVYAETRQNVLEESPLKADVAILKDGFTQFQVKFEVRWLPKAVS